MVSMGYVKYFSFIIYGILNGKVIQSYLKGPRRQKRRELRISNNIQYYKEVMEEWNQINLMSTYWISRHYCHHNLRYCYSNLQCTKSCLESLWYLFSNTANKWQNQNLKIQIIPTPNLMLVYKITANTLSFSEMQIHTTIMEMVFTYLKAITISNKLLLSLVI